MVTFNQYSSGGFPLGIDWSRNPEHIPDGALFQAEQCEYDAADGALRTVEGVAIKFDAQTSVDSLFYDTIRDLFYFTSGQDVYKIDSSFTAKTKLGTLTGNSKPVYCNFGGDVIVASGKLLQVITGNPATLQTVTGSPPVSHYVTSRQGRVVAFSTESDVLNYSAIGDYTNWTNTAGDKSSGQFLDVGYKDPGNLIAVDFLSKVMIVYKQHGRAYQVIGEPQDDGYACLPLSQTASCLSANATCNVDGKSYYAGQAGFMSFVPTDDYGNIAPNESGLNINSFVAQNIDANCCLWHVQSKKQIWMKTQNDKRVYLYHYIPRYDDGRGAWTARTFSEIVNDVCDVGAAVYVAYGNKIGRLSTDIDTDDGLQIETSIIGNNKLSAAHSILIMNQNFVSYNIIDGYGTIKCGKKVRNVTFTSKDLAIYDLDLRDIYSDEDEIYKDDYTRIYRVGGGSAISVQLSIFVQKGAISVRKFDYQYIEV